MASKKSNVAMFALLGLLILGLAGFGATNFSGTVTEIGRVGETPIRAQEYANALNQQIRSVESQAGRQLTLDEARAMGITSRVLDQLINQAALDDEAARIGLSVGDETLAEQILDIPAFQGADGFNRESYAFALGRAGLSEAEFEEDLRRETARSLLQAAIAAGAAMPDTYADTLASWARQTRTVSFARLDESDLAEPIPAPTQEQLQAFYDENIADFTLPERKRITYALLSPDMVLDEIELPEDRIRQEYEARITEFRQPERRLLERLVFSSDETAQAARARLDAGDADFDTLVEERGLTLTDIDMGDVAQSDLPQEAGEAVFSAPSGEVVGPVETDLGPALFRINGVLTAQEVPYEEAAEQIRDELSAGAARREVERRMEPIEDLLAGGATLEELAQDTGMEIDTIDWSPDSEGGIAAYTGFQNAATALQEDDYPELRELSDGAIYAMRLDEVLPAEPQPFDQVEPRLRDLWKAEQTAQRLRAQAEEVLPRLREGATFREVGLDLVTETGLTRNGSVSGTPRSFSETVFSMQEDDVAVTEGFGAVLVLRLDGIAEPDLTTEEMAQLRANVTEQASNAIAQDIYVAFLNDVRARASVSLDQAAISAVEESFR